MTKRNTPVADVADLAKRQADAAVAVKQAAEPLVAALGGADLCACTYVQAVLDIGASAGFDRGEQGSEALRKLFAQNESVAASSAKTQKTIQGYATAFKKLFAHNKSVTTDKSLVTADCLLWVPSAMVKGDFLPLPWAKKRAAATEAPASISATCATLLTQVSKEMPGRLSELRAVMVKLGFIKD